MIRRYHAVAIPIRIVLNSFGDHNPNGMIFVLKENEQKVKKMVEKNPFSPVDLVQPLIIRANEGDTVEILLENQLSFHVGLHFQQAEYDVRNADGVNVGLNDESTVSPDDSYLYRIHAVKEGTYYFSDLANPSSGENGSNSNGLFGALFVQKRFSWWTDPETGKPMNSGVYADIHHPILPSFREYAWVFHDEMEVDDLTGNRPINHLTNQEEESFHGANYRYEPVNRRQQLITEGVVCPNCEGEEVHHDSWVYGDPSTPILRGYIGDPAKIRVVHGGVKETHVFHYHVHQWLSDTQDLSSEIFDAQATSPQSHYTIEPLYGLGSLQGSFGDAVIHCHLYPHFAAGMWGMNRVFNTLQDGSQCYPNGVPIKSLQPLPDRKAPPKPTKLKPGFPNFIPGKVGYKAPRPPLGIVGGRGLTELEKNAAIEKPRPGAVFTDPCIGEAPVKVYNISLIELPVTYNKQGWHDPKGRVYVLDEDLEAVCSGEKEPEPLVIHASAHTCFHINYTNRLPHILDGDAFQLVTRTYETGFHIHFVKFDVLVNDGANVGWNYDSSILPGETMQYSYYADVELKAWFFHDHMYPNAHQQHGVFGTGVVHPRFTKFLDCKTGEEVVHGTQITSSNPLIPDYRDFALFVQDFALLFDKNGKPLQPPKFPGSDDDPGLFGVNYKNEPLQFRLGPDADPAYSFSSYTHGDPITPILRAYEGDSIRIRLLQGAQEESHSFNVHGLSWLKERGSLDSNQEEQQHIGISESFTMETYIPRSGDYLWAFETEEDLWNGLWGLIRAYDEKVPDLIPLSDRPKPSKRSKPLPECNGKKPPQAENPVLIPVENGPVRYFDIVAFQCPIVYNDFGDHDPHGIIFALREDMDAIVKGTKNPEPLIIRANVGDTVEVTLTSLLEFDKFPFKDGIHPYPEVKEQAFYPPSLRISLHPQLIQYDVKNSAGETVGFNGDQTIGPGEKRTYRWWVVSQVGACGMWDMADIRNHKSHGAFGAFIAEPRGTEYLDPYTLKPVRTGANVILRNPFLPEIREFVMIMHDGVRLLDKNNQVIFDPVDGILLPPPEIDEDLLDTYDQGSRGFNYRSERLINRYQKEKVLHDLFSSHVFGDPATPLFESYVGDPVTIRLVTPSERRRSHTFNLHGHRFRFDTKDINSRTESFVGFNVAGAVRNLELLGGAGAYGNHPGDYMYRSGNIQWDIEQGMWGIMRVYNALQEHLPPLKIDLDGL
ncbi:multicopper oxidase domain-containing protein [Sporosarcina sp. Marseille-Q4063]|uniref:multicopper oxidase domain-containing protein n=1 Tax=Sporosarcina sp. Marseille-Q4063 TaxID=2810514 RepID=UPI001BB0C46C|nr:multicopper oxidase domain-containing protein [Sporosarcina sp. Marseille-Q4063]QUW23521.1 multicopper oxidase domain-containing protein [Sporosarcina sp. Marseille-Q4063]